MEKLFIPVILGTARVGRASERVARFVVKEVEKRANIETELVDVRDHAYTATTPPWGEGGANDNPTPWKGIAGRAHGFVLVVPEYNRGYPGELKMFLDSLHDDYDKKPALICGVSNGVFGGRALAEHIRPVLAELKFVPIRGAVYFSKAKETFDEEGNSTDPKQSERLGKSLENLLWYARVLKSARAGA